MDIEREFRIKQAIVETKQMSKEDLEEYYIELIKAHLDLKDDAKTLNNQLNSIHSKLTNQTNELENLYVKNNSLQSKNRTFNQSLTLKIMWGVLLSWGFFVYFGYSI